jgi:hypothetical protein
MQYPSLETSGVSNFNNVTTYKPDKKMGFCSFLDFSNASSPQGYLGNGKYYLNQHLNLH